MIYWLIFISFLLLLLSIYNTTPRNQKKYIFSAIAFIVIYFSAFRDGLGMDYQGYTEHCKTFRPLISENYFFSEPLATSFTNYIYKSQFSYVLYFVATSILINYLCLYVYSKTSNFSIATFFYVCYAGLYVNSFNIVRQFVVASIFLYASYLWNITIPDRNKPIYRSFAILIVFSSIFIHKSAIILIPILILSRHIIKPKIACIILILSYIIPFTKLPIFSDFMSILEFMDYDNYEDHDNIIVTKYSLSNIYLNILCIISIIASNKKIFSLKDHNYNSNNISIYKFTNNMILLCMISYNLSANGFVMMYRVAIYFIVFFPIIVGILPKIINKYVAYCLIIIPPIILMATKIIGNDPIYFPNTILPLSSIFK